MKIIIVPFMVLAALIWASYEWIIKKNIRKAKEIFSITLFFGGAWVFIFYWLFI